MLEAEPLEAFVRPEPQSGPSHAMRSPDAAGRPLSSFEGVLLMSNPSSTHGTVASRIGRAAKSCQLCAAECSLVLLQDIFFGKNAGAASGDAFVLLACADACQRTGAALAQADASLVDACEACARACNACMRACEANGPRWAALAAACDQCELYLADVAAALGRETAHLSFVAA